jgi:hypothetical protein
MDGNGFDRMVKALTGTSIRRQALRASLAGALATAMAQLGQDAEAKKKRKKKKKNQPGCAGFTAPCTSAGSCCGNEFGVVACRAQPVGKPGNCATQFPGLRCCGVEGVICDPDQGHCGCCDQLRCTVQKDLSFRCSPLEI